MKRTDGKNSKLFSYSNYKSPLKQGILGGQNDQLSKKFRVSTDMNVSILLCIEHVRDYKNILTAGSIIAWFREMCKRFAKKTEDFCKHGINGAKSGNLCVETERSADTESVFEFFLSVIEYSVQKRRAKKLKIFANAV